MKINASKLGLAAAIGFGVVWVACSLLVISFPGASMTVMESMMHADSLGFNWNTDFSRLVSGFVSWSLFAGLSGWILLKLNSVWNHADALFQKKKKTTYHLGVTRFYLDFDNVEMSIVG